MARFPLSTIAGYEAMVARAPRGLRRTVASGSARTGYPCRPAPYPLSAGWPWEDRGPPAPGAAAPSHPRASGAQRRRDHPGADGCPPPLLLRPTTAEAPHGAGLRALGSWRSVSRPPAPSGLNRRIRDACGQPTRRGGRKGPQSARTIADRGHREYDGQAANSRAASRRLSMIALQSGHSRSGSRRPTYFDHQPCFASSPHAA